MMDADWINSADGRKVVAHLADTRAAWLWSDDGQRLIWRNAAAVAFGRRRAEGGETHPIKGQVARLIRLGVPGRSSLSRIQFLAGGRPVSATCSVTPLHLRNGHVGLLIVGMDPVQGAEAGRLAGDRLTTALFEAGTEWVVLDKDGAPLAGSDTGLRLYGSGPEVLPHKRYPAGPDGAELLLLDPPAEMPAAVETEPQSPPAERATGPEEPLLPMELPVDLPGEEPLAEQPSDPAASQWEEDFEADLPHRSLASLFDRLADAAEPDAQASDDEAVSLSQTSAEPSSHIAVSSRLETAEPASRPSDLPTRLNDEAAAEETGSEIEGPLASTESELEAGAHVSPAELVPEPEAAAPVEAPKLYKVTGRRFAALRTDDDPDDIPGHPEQGAEPPMVDALPEQPPAVEEPQVQQMSAPDPETVERVSRYNFDELSRILNDRVGGDDHKSSALTQSEPEPARLPPSASVLPAQREGQLVSLAGETFILNRLPLGILVFRDQQVLFANRSITEMIGYGSIDELRSAGLAAIFPATGEGEQEAGPVNHLMQRDGSLVPVTARLQSISWQGKPALMLSASTTEVRTGHEAAVRAFAEMLAEAREEGFIDATRAGVISSVSARARTLLGMEDAQVLGRALSVIVAPEEWPALKAFLERPARFAETARPALVAKTIDQQIDLLLFAQGQAGVVTGYFGLLRQQESGLPALSADDAPEPSMLSRLSRSVRRPLNTIIGFSDLIRSGAFGTLGNERYVEYARDIKTAGQEIAALVDELDDYARLKEGRYAARVSDLDLQALLESCIVRVRGQAGSARVLVRSAISESLPRIRADRASLGQGVLNLLASAIDQTPQGGTVILSSQLQDDGSVAVHVRDSSSATGADLSERFVVFRDGLDREGGMLAPVRSTVGLALTRSLLAVNSCALSVDPAGGVGTLFSLVIPAELVVKA